MKEITLSAAHYKAIQVERGSASALQSLLTDIQDHVVDIQRNDVLPIQIEFFGPTDKSEQVAIVMPVRAAAWTEGQKGFRVNLLTCGFGADNDQSLDSLFNALINPKVSAVITPEALEDKNDEPAHEPKEEVIGLIVGSHAHPSAFIRWQP